MIDWGTKCQGDTFIPKNIVHVAITLLYNNINYGLGVKKKKDVHPGVQSIQLDMRELFLQNIGFFFCVLISGSSAHSRLLFCAVIHYIGAKYGLDCPVVTLHLSGSLLGLNKSHMQILMEALGPFISRPVAGGERERAVSVQEDLFSDPKEEILIQLRAKWSIRHCSGRAGCLPTAKF